MSCRSGNDDWGLEVGLSASKLFSLEDLLYLIAYTITSGSCLVTNIVFWWYDDDDDGGQHDQFEAIRGLHMASVDH